MLEEHLGSSPFAKVAFVGHSLGGSLGSLLMLMFLNRGVLPHSALSPTYTFGAPAIFCEACGPGGTCALNSAAEPHCEDNEQKTLPSASSKVSVATFQRAFIGQSLVVMAVFRHRSCAAGFEKHGGKLML